MDAGRAKAFRFVPPPPRAGAGRPVGGYDGLCWAMCAGGAILAAAGPLGARVWPADVVNLFRPYALAFAGLTLLACLASRRWPAVLAAAVLVLAEVALLAEPVWAADRLPRGAGDGRPLKVIAFNCLNSNPNAAAVVAWIRAEKPDVLVLEEEPQGWKDALARLADVLPYRASQLDGDQGDTDVFSRLPMTAANAYRPAPLLRVTIRAVVRLADGRDLQVFGLHPDTLRRPRQWLRRNRELELAARYIAQVRGKDAVLAAGDWNTPPWSPTFTRFLRLADLKAADPLVWPPPTRVLAAPGGVRLGSAIDHVAASAGFHVVGCETGPQLGSDHAPQVCRLEAPPGS